MAKFYIYYSIYGKKKRIHRSNRRSTKRDQLTVN